MWMMRISSSTFRHVRSSYRKASILEAQCSCIGKAIISASPFFLLTCGRIMSETVVLPVRRLWQKFSQHGSRCPHLQTSEVDSFAVPWARAEVRLWSALI